MIDIILEQKEVIIKLLLAVVIGGFTGYEREKSNQFAGFRTHILVSMGSCITSIISLELFAQYSPIVNMDPGRLPAQVLSGIGFLGAGAILKNSNGIRGLTTSAGIWTTACIGIAVGYGQYVVAVSAWLLLMVTLYILKNFDKVISRRSQTILKVTITDLDIISKIFNTVKISEIEIKNFQIISKSEGVWQVIFLVEYNRKVILDSLAVELEGVQGVINMDYIK